jgi:hypothetical protein
MLRRADFQPIKGVMDQIGPQTFPELNAAINEADAAGTLVIAVPMYVIHAQLR